MLSIGIIIVVLACASVSFVDAYAQPILQPVFNLGYVLQDIKESMYGFFSQELKEQAIAEHIAQISTTAKSNIPAEVSDRINSKLQELEKTTDPAFGKISKSIQKTGELPRLKSYIDEFYVLRDKCVRSGDVSSDCDYAFGLLEKNTNSLLIVKDYCGKITINKKGILDPLPELESQCPAVKDIPHHLKVQFVR